MKIWKIPVTWEVCGIVEVKANTLEKAMDIVQTDDSIELPTNNSYVDGSFRLSTDDEDTVKLYQED